MLAGGLYLVGMAGYSLQVMYDSLADLGTDVSGMTRPEVK